MTFKLFTIPDCFPCVEMKTFLQANDVPYEEVDVKEQPEVAAAYGIEGAPTLLTIHRDEEVDRITGYSPIRLNKLVEKLTNRLDV